MISCRRERLVRAVGHFGWGYRGQTPIFKREGRGWRLGNGTVITPWIGESVPSNPERALLDIESKIRKETLVLNNMRYAWTKDWRSL